MLTNRSMSINGEYIENLIDGYTVTNVTGREMLGIEQDTVEKGWSDGSLYKSKRYKDRTISVSFVIEGGERSVLNDKLNMLNRILDVENAKLIFRDEPDWYYTGTRTGEANATITLGVVIGSFDIYCADPFKYSVQEYEVEASTIAEVDDEGNTVTSKAFVVNYNGSYKSYPTIETSFFRESEVSEDGETLTPITGKGDCGFVSFFNEDAKIIQLGDPDEADGETFEPSQTLITQSFEASGGWGTAAKALWTQNPEVDLSFIGEFAIAGSLKSDKTSSKSSVYYLKPNSYGKSSKWHGPAIIRPLPADAMGDTTAANWTLSLGMKLAIDKNGQKQRGLFGVYLVNNNGRIRDPLFGITVKKSTDGKTAKIIYDAIGEIETETIDISPNNAYFGSDKSTITIKKSGDNVVFNVGGKKIHIRRDGFTSDTWKVNEILFFFGQHGTKTALKHNGLHSVKFVKDKCDTWKNVPNKFSANDVVAANCRSGEVFLNGASTPEYGALGNDWEEFYLKPGENKIGISYSDWVEDPYAPTFKLKYREVFQ